MIVGTGEFKICRAGWRRKEELMLQPKSNGNVETEFPLLQSTSVFSSEVLQQIGSPTHIMEGNQLYSKPTNLNVKSHL